MDFQLLSTAFTAVAWTLVYIDAIRVGLRDKSYAMPFWALSMNFAWEVMHAVFGYFELGMTSQVGANFLWALFDVGLLYTYFKYGRSESPFPDSKNAFVIWSVCALIASALVQYAFIVTFGAQLGAVYSAWTQNVLISVAFVEMRRRRGSSLGQSKLIAYAKWLGTLVVSIYFGFFFRGKVANYPNTFVIIVGLVCALYDMYYIFLMHRGDKSTSAPQTIPDALKS